MHHLWSEVLPFALKWSQALDIHAFHMLRAHGVSEKCILNWNTSYINCVCYRKIGNGHKMFHSLIQRGKMFIVAIKLPQMTVRLLRTPFLSCCTQGVIGWHNRENAVPILKSSSNFNLSTIKRQKFCSNVHCLFRKLKRKTPLSLGKCSKTTKVSWVHIC